MRWRKDGGPIMRLPVVMPLFKHLPQRLWVLAFLRTYAKKGELSLLNELYDYLPDDVAAELRAPKPVGVVVLGDASVGKTSLIKALLGGPRDEVAFLILFSFTRIALLDYNVVILVGGCRRGGHRPEAVDAHERCGPARQRGGRWGRRLSAGRSARLDPSCVAVRRPAREHRRRQRRDRAGGGDDGGAALLPHDPSRAIRRARPAGYVA